MKDDIWNTFPSAQQCCPPQDMPHEVAFLLFFFACWCWA